jgi:hypothetical protein
VDFEDVFWQTADRQYCWLPTRRKFKVNNISVLFTDVFVRTTQLKKKHTAWFF